MPRLLTVFVFVLALGYFQHSGAQLLLEQHYDLPIVLPGSSLSLPWGGGLNASQYGKADLDGDGVEELVLYDRSANVYQVFGVEAGQLVPANPLASLLPELSPGWVLFADYNGDGLKDIFSNGDRGIVVFKNVSEAGNHATWQKVADPLFTIGFSGKINLIANAADVPAISDIDNDGDLDILVYNFAIGGYIRYNKNLSKENYGHTDSLEYEIDTRTWGEFQECDCNLFAFGAQTCEDLANGRVMHPGGKALLAFDSDGDGDKDLLVGHEQCIELYFYENMGDTDSAYMTGYSNAFPEESSPANFHIFPAGYLEDLDFDGLKDLVVTPSFEENYEFKIDFAHSNWFYKNTGTNDVPDFRFQKDNILQDQMLDFGENAVPIAADINADSNIDLLVAANGHWNGEQYSGYVLLLENTGSAMAPGFVVKDHDYLDLSSLELINPTINLADIDGNGTPDLVYSGMELQNFKPVSWILSNQAALGQSMDFDVAGKTKLLLPGSVVAGDVPVFSISMKTDGSICS
ncbi:MAG: VCBS repeat-containing protein [Cyclobacteriaceae bacterium]|nr:VCBS repeat-containing protein [Cyclobacteriaceae bacterium]